MKFENITLPTTVHSVLMDNKIIEDIYYRNNEIKYNWIAKMDWI